LLARLLREGVVRLLLADGLRRLAGEGMVTGGSGDGASTGLIKEDKLGLDVSAQAKRWEGTWAAPSCRASSQQDTSGPGRASSSPRRHHQDALAFVEKIEGKKVVLIDASGWPS